MTIHEEIKTFQDLPIGSDLVRKADGTLWRKASANVWYKVGKRGNMTGRGRTFSHYELMPVSAADLKSL
jgi:hypothetical protein